MIDHARLEQLADQGQLIAYFGYGSLVNKLTHRTNTLGMTPARLLGWRRSWQPRPDPAEVPIALLSASPVGTEQSSDLQGLLVFDHIDNLPALDEREAGYDRHQLDQSKFELAGAVPQGCALYVYEARAAASPHVDHVILQSYLDAVLQGYYRTYGEEAVFDFIASTARFDTEILTDRDAPHYPRAVELTDGERKLFDLALRDAYFTDTLPASAAR